MKIIPPLSERIKEKTDKSIINLQEYIGLLHEEGSFVIPDYQRGYIWGQRKKDESIDSVSHLIKTIKDAYVLKKEVFLQGITVHGVANSFDIYLVDGQQRTTFFYLLLKLLGYEEYLNIQYQIRKQSNIFLNELNIDSIASILRNDNTDEEEFQDIFFFKRTLRILK